MHVDRDTREFVRKTPGVLPTYGATVTNGCLVDSDESTCSSDEDFEKL